MAFALGPGVGDASGIGAKAVDEHSRANWLKVKQALETAGKTSCHMYLRACVAVKTGRDPGFPLGR